MTDYTQLFLYPGQPADAARIAEIEQTLGKTLPGDYKRLLSQTGGGVLDLKKGFLDGVTLPSGEELEIGVETIFGNGKTSRDSNIDLVEYAMFLMEEWEIPDEVLLLADTEDGMHQCFVINYGLTDFPAGSVLYFDTDPDGQITQVAESVDDFLSKLGPDPSFEDDYHPSAGQEGMGIKGVNSGGLSERLQHAISLTSTPDIEELLRKATESITNSFGPGLPYNFLEGRRFLDVVYWIAQHVEPQQDPRTFADGGREGQELTLMSLLSGSFLAPGQQYGIGYTTSAIMLWWKTRVEEGVLIPTENGYVLDENYIEGVLAELRGELSS